MNKLFTSLCVFALVISVSWCIDDSFDIVFLSGEELNGDEIDINYPIPEVVVKSPTGDVLGMTFSIL